MAFRVLLRLNKNIIKELSVASSCEEFEQFTIKDLKEKALSFFPGVNDRYRLKVIFNQSELEDSQTFESCGIEHLSVLFILLLVPGGGGPRPPNEGFPRSESMERLFLRM